MTCKAHLFPCLAPGLASEMDFRPEHLPITSPCGLASSDHGSCGVIGLLMWLLRDPHANVPSNNCTTGLPVTELGSPTALPLPFFIGGNCYSLLIFKGSIDLDLYL